MQEWSAQNPDLVTPENETTAELGLAAVLIRDF
jgi:hypothetical protein